MSKTLYLLRHAKSSWEDGNTSDFDRGLNNRGQRDAPRMGQALSALIPPQVIMASPARRAQLTLGGLQDGWPQLAELGHISDDALYTFSVNDLVDWIGQQDDALASLFMIGHNPGFTSLVNWVCGYQVLDNLPTAGFAWLQLDIERWQQFSRGCGKLEKTLFPKEL